MKGDSFVNYAAEVDDDETEIGWLSCDKGVIKGGIGGRGGCIVRYSTWCY